LRNLGVAPLELTVEDGIVEVMGERHYRLVPADQISAAELIGYRERTAP
jgi:hypothetical protein